MRGAHPELQCRAGFHQAQGERPGFDSCVCSKEPSRAPVIGPRLELCCIYDHTRRDLLGQRGGREAVGAPCHAGRCAMCSPLADSGSRALRPGGRSCPFSSRSFLLVLCSWTPARALVGKNPASLQVDVDATNSCLCWTRNVNINRSCGRRNVLWRSCEFSANRRCAAGCQAALHALSIGGGVQRLRSCVRFDASSQSLCYGSSAPLLRRPTPPSFPVLYCTLL